MLGFNRRFSPHIRQLKNSLTGRRGPLCVTYRVLADPALPDSWVYSPSGGGRVIGEACHMLDLMNYLVGDGIPHAEIDVICPSAGTAGAPGDNFVVSIRYEDMSLCTLTYTTNGRQGKNNGKERLEAMWDGKSFVVDDFVGCAGYGCPVGAAANKTGKGHNEELRAIGEYLAGCGEEPIPLDAIVCASVMSFHVDAICRGDSRDFLAAELTK